MAVNKKNDKITTDSVYQIVLLVVSAIFVVAMLLVIIKPFKYRSLDSLPSITASEITTQKPTNNTQYFVFIYETDNEETEMVKEKVIEYAKFAKENSDAKKIYILEKTEDNSNTILDFLSVSFDKENGYPCLLMISSGSVAQTKDTVSTILTTLDTEMANE